MVIGLAKNSQIAKSDSTSLSVGGLRRLKWIDLSNLLFTKNGA